MNKRKPADYSVLYATLDAILARVDGLTQMELSHLIGQAIAARPEKGAAVIASEHIQQNHPDLSGFSPRTLRRMRDFYRAYESDPELMAEAMKLNWSCNIVILEACESEEERRWYIHAARQNRWSKSRLTTAIAENACESGSSANVCASIQTHRSMLLELCAETSPLYTAKDAANSKSLWLSVSFSTRYLLILYTLKGIIEEKSGTDRSCETASSIACSFCRFRSFNLFRTVKARVDDSDRTEVIVMRIEYLKIRNFRVFQDVEVNDLPQMAVFLGKNGSGKTTFFDVFGFLHDCLNSNVRAALAMRGGFSDVISREQTGDMGFEIKFRPSPDEPIITYELEIGLNEQALPIVKKEIMRFRRGQSGKPWKILDFSNGEGIAVEGVVSSYDDVKKAARSPQKVASPDILAVKGLGQFENFPAMASLRRLIEDWHVFDFHIDNARTRQQANYSETLSATGDNLAQVAKYLYDNHRERFDAILTAMRERIPGVTNVEAKVTEDGYVILRFQDGKFKNPFIAKNVSDGTIKMFTYLVLLSDPSPHALLCVEEPENQLYPELLPQLAEEFRRYANVGGQVFISTHSPDFLDAISLEELFCMVKSDGYTQIVRAAELPLVASLYREGDHLGELWTQGILLEEATKVGETKA
ncbi:MAG: AAA family ATPase [Clostridia bacterium]|nr:AAA family ATPase [Clostridia bacterium]